MSYLTSRRGRVKHADCRSSTRSYDYGLPQGSAISPVLFNIFVSDLFDEFDFSSDVGADAEISVFADDIRASVYCSDPAQACSILSSDTFWDFEPKKRELFIYVTNNLIQAVVQTKFWV